MPLTLEIPDDVLEGIRLPAAEIEARARLELAVALYAQEILSLGKAAQLAGKNRVEFGDLIGGRGIPRHYDEQCLAQDLAYATRRE